MITMREISFPLPAMNLAEACSWRPENIAEATAALVVSMVPGLRCRVAFERGLLRMHGVYACPCGEESHLEQVWSTLDAYRCALDLAAWARCEAERYRDNLRDHVISEGNTPDF